MLSPGYHAETISFPLGIPCDVDDLVDTAARQFGELRPKFSDRVIPVRPQPLPEIATLLVAPDWTAYSSLSVVCLDLRDVGNSSLGPLAAVYVTRPTCRAELCRQAGIYGVQPCRVFIGTESDPLEEDEAVTLANGCVVTFLSGDLHPNPATDLQYRLQLPHTWRPDVAPPVPSRPRALLLLHQSGRYLFRVQASQLPVDEAAARFVGVDRAAVEFHTPQGDGCSRLQHQCVDTRGILALVDPGILPPDVPQYVVFLDLRQVGSTIKYLVLERPWIPRADLLVLAGRRPPPSWRLRILGGRLRRTRLEVQQGTTLTFGFEFVDASEGSEDSASSSSVDASQESEEEGDTDAQDTTTAPADSDGEHLFADDPRFLRSASPSRDRSRSRSRHSPCASSRSRPSRSPNALRAGALTAALSAASPTGAEGAFLSIQHFDVYRDGLLPVLHAADRAGPSVATSSVLVLLLCICFILWARTRTRLFRFSRPSYTRGPLGCKTLVPLPCRHASDRQRVSRLRRVTQDFGDDWPLPLEDDSPEHSSDEPESSDVVSDSGSVAWATILIYAPLYAPEWLTLALHFPSTYGEAVAVIQAERDPVPARRFPFLTPADPQPIPGVGVFVALAPYTHAPKVVFLDATRWDGRCYATLAPDYLSPAVLRSLCALDPTSDAAFFVGHDAQPLPDEASIHVSSGLAIIVAPVRTPLPAAISIDTMFQRPSLWSQHFVFPPDDSVAYCVVEDQQQVLFSYQNERPTQYRRQLAAALGISYAELVLHPANPRVIDATLDGVSCRTIVAAARLSAVNRHPQKFLVLLDCRAFYAGWLSILVRDGLLCIRTVEDALFRDLPAGWSLSIPEVPPGVLQYQVIPGQVLQAEAIPPAHTPSSDAVDTDRDASQIPPGLASPSPPPGDHVGSSVDPLADSSSARQDVDASPEVALNTSADEFIDLPFIILLPEYLPEVVRVRVQLPQTVHGTLALVSAARRPITRRRFPRLLPVATQTFPERGVLMAAPVWDNPTILLCIDSRVDNRLFAVTAPPQLRRSDVLRLAGLPDDAPVHIYYNDVPWPLREDMVLQPALADLVIILPVDHQVFITTNLADMLQHATGWNPSAAYPGNFHDTAWILSDELHFGFIVRRGFACQVWAQEPIDVQDGEVVEVEFLTHAQELAAQIALARLQPAHPMCKVCATSAQLSFSAARAASAHTQPAQPMRNVCATCAQLDLSTDLVPALEHPP
ncbi:unnamed protein product [Symbiodinium sp. CCMP2592]|nr:unnamed protein product [Symbiodinium sp. CCMP2592]